MSKVSGARSLEGEVIISQRRIYKCTAKVNTYYNYALQVRHEIVTYKTTSEENRGSLQYHTSLYNTIIEGIRNRYCDEPEPCHASH